MGFLCQLMLQTMHSVRADMKTSQVMFILRRSFLESAVMSCLAFVSWGSWSRCGWRLWLLIGLKCIYLSVCVWGVNDRQTTRSLIPMSNQKKLNPNEEGRRIRRLDKSIYFHFKVQSKHSGSVLIGQCRQNNTDPIFAVIIRIANGDVVQLLTKNEKGFEEGIRGFFFFFFSDCEPETFPETCLWCFSLYGLLWHKKWKLKKALLPLKAFC